MTDLELLSELIRKSIETLEGLECRGSENILIHPNVFILAEFSTSLCELGESKWPNKQTS